MTDNELRAILALWFTHAALSNPEIADANDGNECAVELGFATAKSYLDRCQSEGIDIEKVRAGMERSNG